MLAKFRKKDTNNVTESPLFLLGYFRSGTTLLQRILNTFDDICLWGEHNAILEPVAESYQQCLQSKHLSLGKPEKGNAHEAVMRLRNPALWAADINWLCTEDVRAGYRNFLEHLFNPLNSRYWGFKEIRYGINDLKVLDFLKELYPNARFIFIFREPVHCIQSALNFDARIKTPLSKLVDMWASLYRNYLIFSGKFPVSCRFISYDDLIDSNRNSLKELLSFLGLPLAQKQRDVLELQDGRNCEGFSPGRIALNDLEKKRVNSCCGEVFRELQEHAI